MNQKEVLQGIEDYVNGSPSIDKCCAQSNYLGVWAQVLAGMHTAHGMLGWSGSTLMIPVMPAISQGQRR